MTRELECVVKNLARQIEYKAGCSNGTGRLLRLLASQFQDRMIAEIGSGCGVGSVWIISVLAPGTSFVTVEKNQTLAAVAKRSSRAIRYPLRSFWLNDSRLETTEIFVSTKEAVILASRIE